MFKVYAINKMTKEREKVIFENEQEEPAEAFCEAWGWIYDDGRRAFWLEIVKEK